MANLYLTHLCQRGCPFCFARKVLRESGGDVNELLEIEDIKKFLTHFKSDNENIGLLGGEPFLYPYFTELMDVLAKERLHVKIFTSATNPLPEALEKMTLEEAFQRVCFIVNVGTRDTYPQAKHDNLVRFFKKFGPVSNLSYTIFDLNADPSYLFDLIDEYNLIRIIRVGIALPIYNGGNQYIPLEDYKRAGEYFMQLAEAAGKRGITLGMDCGFVACMFTPEQIGRLERLNCHFNFLCGVALDVGPGLKAWNCFPLFQLGRVNVLDYDNIPELHAALRKQNEAKLGKLDGIFAECKDCDMFHRGLCQGGCKSFKSIEPCQI